MPEPINIYFLGTGGGTPFSGRKFPCIAVKYPPYLIFFDFGECCQFSLMNSKIRSFRYNILILISHYHADHTTGIPGLLHTLRLINYEHELTFIGPPGLVNFIKKISEAFLIGKIGFKLTLLEIIDTFTRTKVYETDKFTIISFPTEHSVPSVGYVFHEKDRYKFDEEKARKLNIPQSNIRKKLLEEGQIIIDGKLIKKEDVISHIIPGRKIVYTGDTIPNSEIIEASKNADLLIHEANYLESEREEAIIRKHSTVDMAIQVAKKADVKRLALVHLSSRYKDIESIMDYVNNLNINFEVYIPRDGDIISV